MSDFSKLLIHLVAMVLFLGLFLRVSTDFKYYVKAVRRQRKSMRASRVDFFKKIRKVLLSNSGSARLNKAAWRGTRTMVVQKLVQECSGIISVYLTPYDQKQLPSFLPGQHVTLFWEQLGDHTNIRRCYSLSSSPLQTEAYRISIKHQLDSNDRSGLVSSFIHKSLKAGDQLSVLAPQGKFVLNSWEGSIPVLIGMGIGVTPLLSMLYAMVSKAGAQRDVWLFLGVRDLDHLPFKKEWKELKALLPGLKMILFVSRQEQVSFGPCDSIFGGKRLTYHDVIEMLPQADYRYFLCGTRSMMDQFREGFESHGIRPDQIEWESFGGAVGARSKRKPSGDPIEVKLVRSAQECAFEPQMGSLLDLLEKMEAPVGIGCRTGNCGACATTALRGEILYLQEPGYDMEANQILPCISIPKTALELEI